MEHILLIPSRFDECGRGREIPFTQRANVLMTAPLVMSMATIPLLAVVVVMLSLSVVMVMGTSRDDVTELVVHLQSDDQRPNT